MRNSSNFIVIEAVLLVRSIDDRNYRRMKEVLRNRNIVVAMLVHVARSAKPHENKQDLTGILSAG